MIETLRKPSLQTRLKTARKAAQAAGHTIMAYYASEKQIKTKSSEMDLVTQVDLASDELIREILQEEYPEDTLITEETFQEGQAIPLESTWIIDPIDGTTNYAHGFPHFAVSIGYVENGEPKLGIIFDPFKNEMFTAVLGESATKNGIPIHVSTTEVLEKSLLATGFPYHTDEHTNIDLHSHFLKKAQGIRRAGAAALDLAYVACGRLEGFWEYSLAPWDIAAGMLLVKMAGGQVTDFKGDPVDLSQRKINVTSSNGKLHAAIVEETARAV